MADISTPNLDYNDMLEAWDINDALMGGTLEMRRQGENYLPKWPNEDEDAYKKRLSVATRRLEKQNPEAARKLHEWERQMREK